MQDPSDHPEIPKPYVPGERLEPEPAAPGTMEIPLARLAPTTWSAEAPAATAAPALSPPPLPQFYPPPWLDPAVLKYQAEEAARRRRYRVWPVFTIWGLSFIVQLLAGAIVAGILLGIHGLDSAEHIEEALLRPHVFSLLLLSISVGMMTSVLIATRLSKVPAHLRLGLTRPRAGLLTLLAMLIGTLAVAELVVGLINFLPRGTWIFDQAIGGLSGWRLLIMLCIIGLVGPFAEELLVRGYMMVRLAERCGAWWAILITSALFGIMHVHLVQGFFAACLGVALGYCAWRAQSIWPAVAGHMANNILATLRMAHQPEWADPAKQRAWLIPLSFLLILLSAAWIEWRSWRKSEEQAFPAWWS